VEASKVRNPILAVLNLIYHSVSDKKGRKIRCP